MNLCSACLAQKEMSLIILYYIQYSTMNCCDIHLPDMNISAMREQWHCLCLTPAYSTDFPQTKQRSQTENKRRVCRCVSVTDTFNILLFHWSIGGIVPVRLPPFQQTPDARKSADSSTEGETTRACKQCTHTRKFTASHIWSLITLPHWQNRKIH